MATAPADETRLPARTRILARPHGVHALPAGAGWDRDACLRGRAAATALGRASTSPCSRLTGTRRLPRDWRFSMASGCCAFLPGRPGRDYYLAPRIAAVVGQRERWDLVHCQGIHTPVTGAGDARRTARRACLPGDLPHWRPLTVATVTRCDPPSGGWPGCCCETRCRWSA